MSSGRPKRAAATAAAEQKAEKKGKTGLAVGDTLPDFEVETDESTPDAKKTITSKELVADSGAVIFFYPRANTGGCTTQACGFRDNYDKLVASGYKVYGMSADKPKSQANWKAKHNFQYPLLCDPSYQVLKALGVSKGDKGINRSHLVIAKGGKVEQVHYGVSPKVSIEKAVELIKEGTEEAAEATVPETETAGDKAAAAAEEQEAPAAEGKENETGGAVAEEPAGTGVTEGEAVKEKPAAAVEAEGAAAAAE